VVNKDFQIELSGGWTTATHRHDAIL